MGRRSGRPRAQRERRKDGRLVPLIDKGNDRVQQRREAFKVFQGGKADQQVHDPIGRAWAVGLLDGQAQDAAILRDIGRRYAGLHAAVFRQVATRIGELEPRSRGSGTGTEADPLGEHFERLDALARSAGSKERLAMRKLCCEGSPDEDPVWLARLLADAVKPGIVAAPAHDRDWMILAQAVAALVAMVEGTGRAENRFAAQLTAGPCLV